MIKDLVPRNMFNLTPPYKMTKTLFGLLAEARLFLSELFKVYFVNFDRKPG